MKKIKKINKESLFEAIKIGYEMKNKAQEAFNKVPGAWNKNVANKDDPRDLMDLAMFLKYERKINGTGEVLSDEEFEKECKDLITAFADYDCEKMYNYLDRWFNFAYNYNPPENIETVDDALQNFIYLRAKQGLADTKLKRHPDYVKSRFNTLDSIMKLQKLQVEINIQSENCDVIYHANGFKINTETYTVLTSGTKQEKKNLEIECLAYSDMAPEVEERMEVVETLNKAFDLTSPSKEGEVEVKEVTFPKWVNDIDLDETKNNRLRANLKDFCAAIRESIGVDQTSAGLLSKYLSMDLDKATFKFIFIDGVSVYDSMPEPKNIDDCSKKLLDAIQNKTGVVSFVHAANINGEFKYRIDTIDCKNDKENKEYDEKINNLKSSEESRKGLYQSIENSLTPYLKEASKTYTKNCLKKLRDNASSSLKKKDDALKKGEVYEAKAPDGTTNISVDINKKNVGLALMTLGEIRDIYTKKTHEFLEKNPGIDYKLKSYIPGLESVKCDKRDFIDLFIFAKLAKTFGLGEKNLEANEDKDVVEEMLTGFANRDHEVIGKYLDYMFDFLKSYKVPEKIETVDEMILAIMYIRVQQTTSVKQKENPWYVPDRCKTTLEKGQFEVFETDYFNKYQRLEKAFLDQTKIKVASTYNMALVYKGAKVREQEEQEALDAEDGEIDEEYLLEKRNVQKHENYAFLRESLITNRKAMVDKTQEFEGKYTFKITLPDSALIACGDDVKPEILKEARSDFYYSFISCIFTTDYADSKVLRDHYFENAGGKDTMRLIFVDGRSVYDIINERDGKFNELEAGQFVLQTLVNQTGLVQFAHVIQGENEIKVELDTLDVSSPLYVNDEYVTKLANYESNPNEIYNRIKTNINQVLGENKRKCEEEIRKLKEKATKEENEKYNAAIPQDEIDFFNLGDVFDKEAEAPKVRDIKKGQEQLFKTNRANVLRKQLSDLSSMTYGRFRTNRMLNKFEQVLGQENFNKEEYCKLWKEVWKQTMEGLKFIADGQDYTRPVPFTYATNMVERCMRGALELYGFDKEKVPPFGGMQINDMTRVLRSDVSDWEQKHYEMFFDKLTRHQLAKLPKIDVRFKKWKAISIEQYKNLSFSKAADKYRDENGKLNEEGKVFVTKAIIEFYDRVKVIADTFTFQDVTGENPELAEELRGEMYEFVEELKQAAIDIGALDKAAINKISGKSSPLADEIDKFKQGMEKMLKFENKLNIDARIKEIQNEKAELNNFVEDEVYNDEFDDDIDLNESFYGELEYKKQIAVENAKEIDFKTFKDGRYDKLKKDPHSAYAMVAMSEMRELEVYFGGMQVDKYEKNYIKMLPKDNVIIENFSDDYAAEFGVKIPQEKLNGVIDKMIQQNMNLNSNDKEVDKTIFTKEYALLFKDLYTETLHTLNKKCCLEGKTITSENMSEAFRLLNQMMQNATKVNGYPEVILNGGYTIDGIKNIQNDFIEKFIPKNSKEQALRHMQAKSNNYDFENENWKEGLGYSAFTNLISSEQIALDTKDLHVYDERAKAAQLYSAMVEYNSRRTRWSKFWNWRKNRAEKAAIQNFKETIMEKGVLDERGFEELLNVEQNDDIIELRNGVEKNYQDMLNEKDNSMEKDVFKIGGVSDSQSNLDNSMIEKISVIEAENDNDLDEIKVDNTKKEEVKVDEKMNPVK